MFSTSSRFPTATNLSCLRRIRYHLSVTSYDKYILVNNKLIMEKIIESSHSINNNNNNNNCLKSNIQCIEIRVQWTVHLGSSHMHVTDFGKYVTNIMLEKYEMNVPKEFVVHVVGYECYIYECTQIILCRMMWSLSCDSINKIEYIPPIVLISLTLYKNADISILFCSLFSSFFYLFNH